MLPLLLVLFLFFSYYSCCTMLYKLQVCSMFKIFKGYTSFILIVNHLRYSPCYTIYILVDYVIPNSLNLLTPCPGVVPPLPSPR